MTVLGKILVFVNLAFSLLTAGLIVMTYTTRVNWKDTNAKTTAAATAAMADAAAADADMRKQVAAAVAATGVETRAKAAFETQLADSKRQVTELTAQYEELKKTKDVETQLNTAIAQEKERRRVEVEKLQGQVADKDKRIVDLEKRAADLREKGTQAQISFDQARDRNNKLLDQVAELQKKIFNIQQPTNTPGATPKLPPPDNVRATITEIQGNLAAINLGSDAGIVRDQELTIYRLEPTPAYLGVFRVTSSSPQTATGQITLGGSRQPVKVSDKVGTNILGVGR